MTKKDKILYSYISNIINDEKPDCIQILTSQDISKLIEISKIHNKKLVLVLKKPEFIEKPLEELKNKIRPLLSSKED